MLYKLVSKDHIQQLHNEISNTRMTVFLINCFDQYHNQVLVVDAWVELLHIDCGKTVIWWDRLGKVVGQEIRTAANRVLQLILHRPQHAAKKKASRSHPAARHVGDRMSDNRALVEFDSEPEAFFSVVEYILFEE